MTFDNFKKAQITMDETFIVGAGDINNDPTHTDFNKHRRRLSDPPKYYHDNIKSVHYMAHRK